MHPPTPPTHRHCSGQDSLHQLPISFASSHDSFILISYHGNLEWSRFSAESLVIWVSLEPVTHMRQFSYWNHTSTLWPPHNISPGGTESSDGSPIVSMDSGTKRKEVCSYDRDLYAVSRFSIFIGEKWKTHICPGIITDNLHLSTIQIAED